MKISPRERIVLLVGLAATVILVGTALLPGRATGVQSLADETKRSRQIAADLAKAREEVSGLETRIAGSVVDGTPRQLIREMVEAAQRAGRVAGIRIEDLKPADLQKSAGFQRVPVQVTLSAPFPKAARFLYELQRRDDRYRVQQLRMNAADGASEAVDIELQLVAFVKGDEDDAGS